MTWLRCVQFFAGLTLLLCTVSMTCAADPVTKTDGTDWTAWEDEEEELEVWDPIEPFNRGMFWFNDKLYFYLLKPVAKGYRFVVPEPGREAVDNVFTNLSAPVRVLNSFLQGKVQNGSQRTDGARENTHYLFQFRPRAETRAFSPRLLENLPFGQAFPFRFG